MSLEQQMLRRLGVMEREAKSLRRSLVGMRQRRRTTRADAMREIAVGEYADFRVRDDIEAAAVRGSAYHALGRGVCKCERVSRRVVRVHRVKGQ